MTVTISPRLPRLLQLQLTVMLKLLFLLVLFHFQTGMGITIPVTVQKRAASFSSPSGILFEYGSTSSASSSESAQPDVVNVGNNLVSFMPLHNIGK